MDGDEEEKVKPKPVQKLTDEEQWDLDFQLHQAASWGDVGEAEELIKKGSNPNNTMVKPKPVQKLTDEEQWELYGGSPLTAAARNGHESIVQLLLNNNANPNLVDKKGYLPLTAAVKYGHESIVQLLLNNNADPNLEDGRGYLPLTRAAESGYESIVQLLLNNNADLNLIDKYGRSPLTAAAKNGHESIVQLLLNNNADPNLVDKSGYLPLTRAAESGHESIVQLLLNNNADPNLVDGSGIAPLSWAAQREGHESIVVLLLQHKADPNISDKDGYRPIHLTRSPEIAETLFKAGADYTARTNEGDSVLHTSSYDGMVDVLDYFLKKGMNVEDRNKVGASPLHRSGSVAVAELLIKNGADVKAVTNFGETPLHSTYSSYIAQCLVSNGADLHSLTPDNNTVLHSAAKYGHQSALKYFIDQGLSLETQNKHGRTPIDILKQPSDNENVSEGRKECLEELKNMGHYYTESDDSNDSDGIGSNSSSGTKKDYTPLLMKAAEEGTVNTKWTNYSIGGASGAGKTSVFNLLVDNPPVLEHDSTPVVKPLPLCLHQERECSNRDDQMESHLIVSDKRCQWKTAEKDDLHRKLAECIQALGGVDAISSHGKEKAPRVPTTSSSTHIEIPTTRTSTDSDSSSSPISSSTISSITSVPSRIQPQACLAKSEATRKVLELLAVVKQAVELDQTHFIHLLDTGGQASFIDIAPALLRFNSVNIFVHKLNERLEDVANFYYSVQGAKIGEEHRNITNEELLSQLFSARRGIKQPEVNKSLNRNVHGEPHMLIVGTYFDDYERLKKEGKLQETIEEKNRRLLHVLDADEQVIVDYKPSKIIGGSKTIPETIFPLNAISRDDRTKEIAERIRKLASEAYMEAEIPVRWYLVQIDLNELKADKQDMVSIEEVYEKASVFAMNKEDIQAALQYFHDLTICLYFHQVLPNIVFLSPECLFNKLSEIIAVSLGEHSGLFQRPVVNHLLVKGIFNITLFDSLPDGFSKDLFTVNDFLRLMKHLLVITPLSDGKHFFIPCVLRTRDNPMDDLEDCEVEPVVLKWKDAVPSGLFPSLAMALYQSKVTKIKAFESKEHVQFRNRLSFDCPDLEACLILFELPKFIGVTHTASAEDSPIVLEAVMKGVEYVVKSFEWKEDIAHPKVGFLCKAQDSEQATFFSPNKNKSCLIGHGYKKLPIDQQHHLSWFTKEVCPPVPRPPSKKVIPKKPKHKEVFDILKKRSAQWNRFAIELEVSRNFLQQLKRDASTDTTEKLYEVLYSWMESETRPVTWDTVLDVLHEMEMTDLTREVLEHIQ